MDVHSDKRETVVLRKSSHTTFTYQRPQHRGSRYCSGLKARQTRHKFFTILSYIPFDRESSIIHWKQVRPFLHRAIHPHVHQLPRQAPPHLHPIPHPHLQLHRTHPLHRTTSNDAYLLSSP
ncbi:hypothetical protein T440DRAFT_234579 [Plenodomus tracheiphilus IPT5]|uniref:Uncharacterized protein n=1 Tax=Plenodomus tracheiphilus IPT5 TaxID=1408161 RepID=A0A6A7BJ99_9PLEO|nr:hypothetical protein T440DRAFT_234579 [Plenodomus tracheiphilus IPT5]